MKYYYEPNDKWYDTKQELVDAYNEDFEGTHTSKVTIDNWTEEQWDIIWKPKMKKLEIKTENVTLLVVDLPECKTHLFYEGYYVMDSSDKGLNDKCRKISQGDTQGFYYIGTDCKYLGKVSEITEEEWNNIVYYDIEFDIDEMEPSTTSKEIEIIYYNDYINKTIFGDCTTATESGLSLLKSNGVFMNEKYQYDDNHLNMRAMESDWSNPHVFIKVD